jgi:hypothetical protein
MVTTCTDHDHHEAPCRNEAKLRLAWCETIGPGWTTTTARDYCGVHGWLAVARLHRRGIEVTVTERGELPRRIRGEETHLLAGVTTGGAVG